MASKNTLPCGGVCESVLTRATQIFESRIEIGKTEDFGNRAIIVDGRTRANGVDVPLQANLSTQSIARTVGQPVETVQDFHPISHMRK